MLTTSKTTTSGMLAVLPYSSVTGRDMTTMLASIGETGGHFLIYERNGIRNKVAGHPKRISPSIDFRSKFWIKSLLIKHIDVQYR